MAVTRPRRSPASHLGEHAFHSLRTTTPPIGLCLVRSCGTVRVGCLFGGVSCVARSQDSTRAGTRPIGRLFASDGNRCQSAQNPHRGRRRSRTWGGHDAEEFLKSVNSSRSVPNSSRSPSRPRTTPRPYAAFQPSRRSTSRSALSNSPCSPKFSWAPCNSASPNSKATSSWLSAY